jgi:hypothetical protein
MWHAAEHHKNSIYLFRDNMNPIYGTQPQGDFVNYLTYVNARSLNPMGTASFVMARAHVNNMRWHSSLEDLLADRGILPENTNEFSTAALMKYIMYDGNRSNGTVYPELGVVAYSGKNIYDRPVVEMIYNLGEPNEFKRYYATPDFNKLVVRV